MEQKAKRVGKFNVIDIIAVILILAVVAFGAWKLLGSRDGGEAGESSMVQVTYVVRAEGVPVELYENCLEHLPSPLMASGAWWAARSRAWRRHPITSWAPTDSGWRTRTM